VFVCAFSVHHFQVHCYCWDSKLQSVYHSVKSPFYSKYQLRTVSNNVRMYSICICTCAFYIYGFTTLPFEILRIAWNKLRNDAQRDNADAFERILPLTFVNGTTDVKTFLWPMFCVCVGCLIPVYLGYDVITENSPSGCSAGCRFCVRWLPRQESMYFFT
jgi:hypothetical protein